MSLDPLAAIALVVAIAALGVSLFRHTQVLRVERDAEADRYLMQAMLEQMVREAPKPRDYDKGQRRKAIEQRLVRICFTKGIPVPPQALKSLNEQLS